MNFNDKLFDFLVATDQLDNFFGKNSKDKGKKGDSETKIIDLQEENVSNVKENKDEDKENNGKREDFSSKN